MSRESWFDPAFVTRTSSLLSSPAPHARQPRLLPRRQARGPVVVSKLVEFRRSQVTTPGFHVPVRAVALPVPPLPLLPRGFELNTPRGLSVARNSSSTRGNSWLGT